MKKATVLFVILALALTLGGCASGVGIPKQLPDALHAACDLYTRTKPEIIKARAYAIEHWNDKVPGTDRDLIPAEVKKTLQELDTYLPQLDAAGLALCSASEGFDVFAAGSGTNGKVDWNQVLTVVVKGASMAIDLKSKGVI